MVHTATNIVATAAPVAGTTIGTAIAGGPGATVGAAIGAVVSATALIVDAGIDYGRQKRSIRGPTGAETNVQLDRLQEYAKIKDDKGLSTGQRQAIGEMGQRDSIRNNQTLNSLTNGGVSPLMREQYAQAIIQEQQQKQAKTSTEIMLADIQQEKSNFDRKDKLQTAILEGEEAQRKRELGVQEEETAKKVAITKSLTGAMELMNAGTQATIQSKKAEAIAKADRIEDFDDPSAWEDGYDTPSGPEINSTSSKQQEANYQAVIDDETLRASGNSNFDGTGEGVGYTSIDDMLASVGQVESDDKIFQSVMEAQANNPNFNVQEFLAALGDDGTSGQGASIDKIYELIGY